MKITTIKTVAIVLSILAVGCRAGSGDGGGDITPAGSVNTGNNGQAPSNNSDCHTQNAIGTMGFLLKNSKCQPQEQSVCGNKIIEAGEGCDDGAKNGIVGNKCDVTCKLVPGKSTSTGAITIAPTTISGGVLGSLYKSATICPTPKKSGVNYVWPSEGQILPDGFSLSTNSSPSSKNCVNIVSKDPAVHAKDGYKATVKVCLQSDSTNCATREYAFTISDEINIKAYDLKDLYYSVESLYEDGKPFCTSKSCGEFIVQPDSLVGTAKANYEKGYGGYMMIVFHASGLQKDDQSFTWSISVDGKDLPNSDVKSSELLTAYSKGNKTWPTGLFLLDYAHDKKVDADSHFLAFDTSLITNGGVEYKNVVITVSNAHGGQQTLKFDKITIPSLAGINKAKEDAKVPPVVVDNPVTDCKSLDLSAAVKGQGIQKDPFSTENTVKFRINDIMDTFSKEDIRTTELKPSGGTAPYKFGNFSYPSNGVAGATETGQMSVNDKNELRWPNSYQIKSYGDIKQVPEGGLLDSAEFDLTDAASCKRHVVIDRYMGFPKKYKIKDLKTVHVEFDAGNIDDGTMMEVMLIGKWGEVLARSSLYYVSDDEKDKNGNENEHYRNDPGSFNDEYSLTCTPAYCDTPVDQVDHAYVYIKDTDSSWHMWVHMHRIQLDVGSWHAYTPYSLNQKIESNGKEGAGDVLFSHETGGQMWYMSGIFILLM